MRRQDELDAQIYEEVHSLVYCDQLMMEPPRSPCEKKEHRREERVSFPVVQLMAPFDGEHLPKQESFQHVRFRDLSSHGFSYIAGPAMPSYRHVIVLLGKLPFRVLWAEVRHVRRGDIPEEYIVGCRIVKRL